MKYERITTESFIKRAKEIHKDAYDYSETVYVNAQTKVIIKCKVCGNRWETSPHNHTQGRGCKPCQYKRLPQNQPISHENFVKSLSNNVLNNFELLSEYKNKRTYIEVKCKECGYVCKKRPDVLKNEFGCKKCLYKRLPQNQPIPTKEYEMMASKVHNNKYEYFQDYKGGRYKIKIRCKKHDYIFYQEASAHLIKEQGCPICKSSKGELKIQKFLLENKIDFVTQKEFHDCVNDKSGFKLRFDIYLERYYIIIEFDGEQHFYPVSCFGGKKRFLEQKRLDKIKNDYCQEKGIKLIRIPFYEFNNIETILRSELCHHLEKEKSWPSLVAASDS